MRAIVSTRALTKAFDRIAFSTAPDPRVVVFERVFIITFALYVGSNAVHAREWLSPVGFHPPPYLVTRCSGLAPLLLLPAAATTVLSVTLFFGLVTSFTKCCRRVGLLTLLAIAVYIDAADPLSSFTLNRIYIIALALLGCWSPADARRTRLLYPNWPAVCLRATLVCVYFTSGTCKVLHGHWLQDPHVLWSQVQGAYRTEFCSLLLRVLPVGAWALLGWSVLAFELTAPVLFILPRTRPWAIGYGMAMHSMIALTMHRLIFFSLQMMAFYLLFSRRLDWRAGWNWCRLTLARIRGAFQRLAGRFSWAKDIDPVALTALLLSVGAIWLDVARHVAGSDMRYIPDPAVWLVAAEIGDDPREYPIHVLMHMSYFNSASESYGDLVLAERVVLKLGSRSYKYEWGKFVTYEFDTPSADAALKFLNVPEVLPRWVAGGRMEQHLTYFGPDRRTSETDDDPSAELTLGELHRALSAQEEFTVQVEVEGENMGTRRVEWRVLYNDRKVRLVAPPATAQPGDKVIHQVFLLTPLDANSK